MTTTTSVHVALAFGANLGQPLAAFNAALGMLDQTPGIEILRLSSLYRSAPWGDHDQDPFLNAVILGRTTLDPRELLELTQSIESALGKQVLRKWGPRVIDIDIVHAGARESVSPPPILPHPRIRSRPFVTLPLAECEPPDEWQHLTEPDEEAVGIMNDTSLLPPKGCWPASAVPADLVLTTASEEETHQLGDSLGRAARPGDIYSLSGPLGAGKSVFCRGLARGLGITGPVQSPSYSLCRQYDTGRIEFQHWDFYRLESSGDLESAGFPESFAPTAVLAIEWADLFPEELPLHSMVRVDIRRKDGENTRELHLRFPSGSLPLRIAAHAPASTDLT